MAFGNRCEGGKLSAGDPVIDGLGGARPSSRKRSNMSCGYSALALISIALGATRSAAARRISSWMRR
jgi:hypothetical protein